MYDLFAHLLRVRPDVGKAVGAMRERVFDTAPQHAVHTLLHVVWQRAV